jgi:hypothetical protein
MHVVASTISRFIDQCLVPFWTILSVVSAHATPEPTLVTAVLRVVWVSTSAAIQHSMAGKCNGSWNFSLCLL